MVGHIASIRVIATAIQLRHPSELPHASNNRLQLAIAQQGNRDIVASCKEAN